MRKMISGVLGAISIGVMALLPTVANASCTQTIYAERAYTSGATTYLYGRTSSTAFVIWYGTTTNATLANAIFAAVAQRNRVLFNGNVATCPTPGTGSFGYVGTINYLYQQP